MSDFAQSGSICTLQRLNEAHRARIAEELEALARNRPVALILPCHGADLAGAAFIHIVEELREARWLQEIIISLNGVSEASIAGAERLVRSLPQKIALLWNDAPEAQVELAALLGCRADLIPHGKGLNVWAGIGAFTIGSQPTIVALQDCDVSSFRRDNLARLCFSCAHPELNFTFAKMYYSRVTDRLYGRVSRLFFGPLLQAVLRVTGHLPLLDFLLAFRYPLAGESAMLLTAAQTLPLASGWGLETALLSELFRRVEPESVCQVDGGSGYDHKHQPLSGSGLTRMCAEIAATLLAQLAAEGVTVDRGFQEALAAAYTKESSLALRRSAALALINGLPFDRALERNAVEAFARHLETSSSASPLLPSWQSVLREKQSAAESFLAAARRPA